MVIHDNNDDNDNDNDNDNTNDETNDETNDVIIIGAGVIGLAVAAEISARFPDSTVIVLEKNDTFGQETSSRSSEVIHGGIYYPPGSLKARLCVKGKKLLYDFCDKWGIPYESTGKLIIARDEAETEYLYTLLENGTLNGVNDMKLLNRKEISGIEPNVVADAALLSPSTGIIDSQRLMTCLAYQARQNGVMFGYRHEVKGMEPYGNKYKIFFSNPDGESDGLCSRYLINCAGLYADTIAAMMGIDIEKAGYRLRFCKGEYFSIDNAKSALVSGLIYPTPLPGLQGLGIHLTKALDGRLRLGPNAFIVDEIDYSIDSSHAEDFYNAVKSFLPFLRLSDLQPDMAGIRPKLEASRGEFRDFIISDETQKGLPGVINLIGMESPALTGCLSIAEMTAGLIGGGRLDKLPELARN